MFVIDWDLEQITADITSLFGDKEVTRLSVEGPKKGL